MTSACKLLTVGNIKKVLYKNWQVKQYPLKINYLF